MKFNPGGGHFRGQGVVVATFEPGGVVAHWLQNIFNKLI